MLRNMENKKKTEPHYWLVIFSYETWREFRDASTAQMGFKEERWKTVNKMQPGDRLLCYVTGIARFIGLLEVTSRAFEDSSPIWKLDVFPIRVGVRVVIGLTPETGVPVLELKNVLSFFQTLKHVNRWGAFFQTSPAKWNQADGRAVERALTNAERNPITRPVDPDKITKRSLRFTKSKHQV